MQLVAARQYDATPLIPATEPTSQMAARFRRKRITSLLSGSRRRQTGRRGTAVKVWESVASARLNAHVFILITHTRSTSCCSSRVAAACHALPCSWVCLPRSSAALLASSAACLPVRCAFVLLISGMFFMLKRQVWHCHLAVTPFPAAWVCVWGRGLFWEIVTHL